MPVRTYGARSWGWRLLVLTGAVVVFAASDVSAQIPDKFTNLKVLPKDISKRELVDVMRQFADALGVRCQFCHVGKSTDSLEGYDFASDDKEAKRTALAMMQMVNEINTKLLPKTGLEPLINVRCVTCHHGVEKPQTLEDLLIKSIDDDGIDAGVALYRKLRQEHYGDGAYDFAPESLNGVAETLAREKHDLDDAVAVLKLNLEFYPDASSAHFVLGQVLLQQGQKEQGLASLEKALELEPDNGWYRQAVERAKQQSGGGGS